MVAQGIRMTMAVAGALAASVAWAQVPQPRSAAEDQVRATELAFAKTMADRDHAAFASC